MDSVVVLPRRVLVSVFITTVSIAHPNEAAARPLQQRKIVSRIKEMKIIFLRSDGGDGEF
jgi:hypothetical protein